MPGVMQKALGSVQEWGQEFSLAVNGAITKDMVISARRGLNIPCLPVPVVNSDLISSVSTFKLLGVQISSDLTWDCHAKYMLSKTCTRIHYLSVARRAGLSPDVLKQFYLTYISLVLE